MRILITLSLTDFNQRFKLLCQRTEHNFILKLLGRQYFLYFISTNCFVEGTAFAKFIPWLTCYIILTSFFPMGFAHYHFELLFHYLTITIILIVILIFYLFTLLIIKLKSKIKFLISFFAFLFRCLYFWALYFWRLYFLFALSLFISSLQRFYLFLKFFLSQNCLFYLCLVATACICNLFLYIFFFQLCES